MKIQEKLKYKKGITLVSVVVTIIILIILAGISINAMLGESGIITIAKQAKENMQLAQEKEQTELNELYTQMVAENGSTGSEGGNLGELEETIKQLEGTVQDLNNQLEQERASKTELENTITDLNGQVENLNQQIAAGNTTIEEQQGTIDNLNTEINSKNEELANKNQTIEQLEGSVSTLNTQVASLNSQITELQKKQATGNAVASDVLNGKTFSNASGIGLTGTMPSYTSGSTAITTSGKWGFDTKYGPWVYIPNNGYYSTAHWINIPWATIKTSLGDAAAANVLSGKTFTSTNGVKVSGTMANRGALNWNPSSSTTYTVQPGYYSGGTLNSSGAYNAGSSAGKAANGLAYVTHITRAGTGQQPVLTFTAPRTGLYIIASGGDPAGTFTASVTGGTQVFDKYLGNNDNCCQVKGIKANSGASVTIKWGYNIDILSVYSVT